MKKQLLMLLCACLLLSGCQEEPTQIPPTDPPTAETMPTESNLPLLEQGRVLEESSNLRYIPNAVVESMVAPEMHLFGNGLLLSDLLDNQLILKHISLEDGSLVQECTVPAGSGTKLYIGSGEIALCDRESGSVTVLSDSFQLLRSFDLPLAGDEWYLNSELDTLYVFYADRGLLARNLQSGEEIWLVENGYGVTAVGSGSGYVLFRYTDRADQKTYIRCLNLSSATMETLPVDDPISRGVRHGDTWLLENSELYGCHLLVQGESVHSFEWTDSPVQLLPLRRHLLVTDASGRNLTLYDTDGACLSQCALPISSNAVLGADFVWSGYWQGYFFTDFLDSTCRLMFWDTMADSEGEGLQLSAPDQVQQTQTVVEQQLYRRAEELSRKFGVDIRIGETCSMDYSHYDTYPMTDPVFIRSGLDILEETLSQYPEGFFHQLHYGSMESIRIELVGGLTAKEGVVTHPSSIGAFAQEQGSYYLIALDGFLFQPSTLYHEFSHIIDARLAWDALLREDALFSEETWLELQPEGFGYAMSYTEMPEDLLSFMDSGYFLSDYGLTYPTEDRAVLMAEAMENYAWSFEPGTATESKLRYYASCIRDCFDTAGWPETTCWEQVLN